MCMISANAAITKYLDYKYFIVLRRCYRVWCNAKKCDNENKNRSRPVFFFGGAVACCHTFFFWRKRSRTVTLPQIATSGTIFIFWLVSRVATFAPNALWTFERVADSHTANYWWSYWPQKLFSYLSLIHQAVGVVFVFSAGQDLERMCSCSSPSEDSDKLWYL